MLDLRQLNYLIMKAIYTLFIILIPFVGFGQIPSYVSQDGLVGWWPFNQNSLDESENNLHLNPQGDAMLVEDRFLEENSAYRFTTNDNNSRLFFNENAYSIINNFSEGSISIWVKINEHNVSGHYFQNDNIFFAKQTDGSNTELLLALRGGTTKIRAHVSNPMPSSVFESMTELTVGNWHNVILTWGNGVHKIYIDGVLDNQQNSNVILSNNTSPTFIGVGALPGIGTNTCNSDIDDIGIWNRALNDEEITDLFISCENTFGTDSQTQCDTYTWIDGVTYSSSNNTATWTLTNAAGCDSVVTLDLIINNSDNTSSSVTACDEFTWDGQTFTESGEYTNTYTNANGCDSTHTLNLIINYSISSNTEASSCSSYEWNGMTYENSGTYEFDTIASNGCDSTAVLELEICYLDQLEINGPTAAVTSTTSSFSVQDNAGSAFIWSIEGLGTISSGQFTNEIFIDWSEIEGVTNICVYEKYDCSGLECLGDTICLEVELKRPAGVVENNLEVNIYPNPSSNIFNLDFNSNYETEISVTNILGEQVYFESVQSVGKFNTQIDLSKYSKGIYNLTIKTSDGISNHKLILQ